MSGAPHDKELLEYRHKIGREEYEKQYYLLYQEAKRSPKRHSGLEYTNSKERLAKIKDKYKNGVTDKILNEFMRSI